MKYEEIEIDEFIQQFRLFGTSSEIVECFTNGFCYWFAYILKARFPKGDIYYHAWDHFVFKYNGKLYDITGDCTNTWDSEYLIKWDELLKKEEGSGYLNSIIQNTILKNRETNEI